MTHLRRIMLEELSQEEVAQLIDAACTPFHRTPLMLRAPAEKVRGGVDFAYPPRSTYL